MFCSSATMRKVSAIISTKAMMLPVFHSKTNSLEYRLAKSSSWFTSSVRFWPCRSIILRYVIELIDSSLCSFNWRTIPRVIVSGVRNSCVVFAKMSVRIFFAFSSNNFRCLRSVTMYKTRPRHSKRRSVVPKK